MSLKTLQLLAGALFFAMLLALINVPGAKAAAMFSSVLLAAGFISLVRKSGSTADHPANSGSVPRWSYLHPANLAKITRHNMFG